MKIFRKYLPLYIAALFFTLSFSSCEEDITVGNLAVDMKYKDKKQTAVTGISARVGEFQFSKSSLPLTFEIVSVVEENGGSTAEIFESIKVAIYTDAVSQLESDEIKASKQDTVMLPAVEVETHTGDFIIHSGNNIQEGTYVFDMKVTNVSGEVILSEAFVLEILPYTVFWFNNFGGTPTIERISDSPNQILFKAYDVANNNTEITADKYDFMTDRESGFEGIFAGDTDQGELWDVQFPVWPASTKVNINGKTANMNFALGVPGNYVIKLYK